MRERKIIFVIMIQSVQEIEIANIIALAVGMFDNVGKAFAFKLLESIFRVEDFENEFLRFRVPFEFGFFHSMPFSILVQHLRLSQIISAALLRNKLNRAASL